MVEISYNISYEMPELNRFADACGLGIESVEFTPQLPYVISIKVDRCLVDIDDRYINNLAEHIVSLPTGSIVKDYKISRAEFVGVKRLLE